jgi:ubiquinone/menaquinone biosynthesis C-methylase UbiE
LSKNRITIEEIEALLCRISGPYQAKRYLDIKKVDRALTKVKSEDRILVEVGAGLCLDLLLLVSHHSIYGVAVDISKQALMTGKSWAKELGIHTQMDFCVADALNLPFRDGQADLVTSYSAIEHLPKRELAQKWINEMSRITRKRGTIILTTSNKLWTMHALIHILKRIKGRRINEFFFHPYELKNMVENAGLCPTAFNGRGLYYYHVIPSNFPGTMYFNLAISKIINSFQNFSCFKVVCGRIGFRAIKKSESHII